MKALNAVWLMILKDLIVIISMVALCNANANIEYDTRTSGLSNAPLDMKYDYNSIVI